ncbi:hypothetical protein HDV06_001358 [Boothiomyces sp. JEL0866]|nr:hypothetical protein HDV06_001358 [Boothiomyces sp. JEL0866]
MNNSFSKSLVFNTVNRNNRSNNIQSDLSYATFYLQNSIKDIIGITLSSFVCPNTFYTIDARNNNFSFTTDGVTIKTVSLPTGVYTSSTFATELASLIQSSIGGAATCSIVCDTNTFKTTITTSVAIQIVDVAHNCYYEAGIIDLSIVSPTFQLVTVSDSTYDFSGVKAINISSNIPSKQVVNTNKSILGVIPVNVGYAGIISYQNVSNHYIDISLQDMNQFTFSLSDERNRTLSVNSDWIITLLFEIEA